MEKRMTAIGKASRNTSCLGHAAEVREHWFSDSASMVRNITRASPGMSRMGLGGSEFVGGTERHRIGAAISNRSVYESAAAIQAQAIRQTLRRKSHGAFPGARDAIEKWISGTASVDSRTVDSRLTGRLRSQQRPLDARGRPRTGRLLFGIRPFFGSWKEHHHSGNRRQKAPTKTAWPTGFGFHGRHPRFLRPVLIHSAVPVCLIPQVLVIPCILWS